MKIGVISDTHGLLRPEVTEHLKDCGLILHGGDICSPEILENLKKTAPVLAVRGNCDGDWASDLPLCLQAEAAGLKICMAHKKKDLPKDLSAFDIAVCGHSHRYGAEWIEQPFGRKRTLLLNPGSCGPRRLLQPVTLAVITAEDNSFVSRRVEIRAGAAAAPKIEPGNIKKQIETVIAETKKGRGVGEIAAKYGMDPALTEQIVRLYVTHPGVTADGIMTKMGL